MLSQLDDDNREHPIAFESRRLADHQLNWAVHEKEIYSIVHTCDKWRHYLESAPVRILTDHKAILELQTQPNLSRRRQVRWLEKLQQFDLHFEHLPGQLNLVSVSPSGPPALRTHPRSFSHPSGPAFACLRRPRYCNFACQLLRY